MARRRREPFRERQRIYSTRAVDTREPLERFLIVCEGEKTEPNYFRSFRVPREVITVHGLGDNTVRIVERAIELMAEGEYDQTWCVFDRDSFPARNFNAALELARRHDIEVAYSNESFELWYVLHFEYMNSGIHRADYITKLNRLLGHRYEKNSDTIYEELEEMQPAAIRNATRLLDLYTPPNPERDNPSTKVHELVVQLNRFIPKA
jgi:hypothetical protein